MTDLTFIEEGNPNNIGTLINFAKRRLLVQVLLDLESYCTPGYDLGEKVSPARRRSVALTPLSCAGAWRRALLQVCAAAERQGAVPMSAFLD